MLGGGVAASAQLYDELGHLMHCVRQCEMMIVVWNRLSHGQDIDLLAVSTRHGARHVHAGVATV